MLAARGSVGRLYMPRCGEGVRNGRPPEGRHRIGTCTEKTRGAENRRDAIIPAQCHAECRGLEIVKSRCNSPFLCSCHTTMERTLAAEPAGLPLARVRLAPCCRDPDSRSLLQLGYLRSLRLDSGWGVQLLVLERMVSIESTRANQYMRTQTQPLPLPTSTL
jgi:hypothetical protein